MDTPDLDDAVARHADRAVALLAALIEQQSTLGQEQGAQEVLAAELEAAGFDLTRLPIPEDIVDDPDAGIPRAPYAGRFDLIGRRGAADAARTLLINGHMDVVPAGDERAWTSPPFSAVIRDGWMFGRGAGDMKAGFAAGMLAIWALDECEPAWMTGGLTLVSAIEEEYTGNGTLAAGNAGYLADAALLLEPTELDILLSGIAIVWVTIELTGRAGHAQAAVGAANPIVAALPIIDALHGFQEEMNEAHRGAGTDADLVFAAIEHPYNVNVGTFSAGDWASSVPATARLDVRVGHPARWTSEQALDRIRAVVLAAVAGDAWFDEHPPTIELSGFRAKRYTQDPEVRLVRSLAAAHAEVHGTEPARYALGSTTDARLYVNRFGVPAAAYGPRTRAIHGIDEAVEIASIVECARTVARFLRDWYRDEGEAS